MRERITDAELVDQICRDFADGPVEMKKMILWDALYLLVREEDVSDNLIRHFIVFAERMMDEQPRVAVTQIVRDFAGHAPRVRDAAMRAADEIEFALRRDIQAEIKHLPSEQRNAIAAQAAERMRRERSDAHDLPTGLFASGASRDQ
jgi:hypothetical protein